MPTVKNLKEFAALAGVSPTTASRALSGSGRMSEDTRRRIGELAEKLGYQPHSVARNLRTRKTNTIGVLIPLGHDEAQHLSDPFFNTMTGFLADELAERGYDLLLSRILPRDDRWLDRYIASGRVDGVVVIGQSNQMHVIESVARRYKPLVVWGGQAEGQVHCAVGSDNRTGGLLAARHLIEGGCRRIAYAGPTTGSEFGERFAGAMAAVRDAGLDETMIHLPSHFEPEAAFADLLDRLGAMPVKPDGIVAGSDVTAIAVLRALAALDIAVPDAIRVIGYDGLPVGAMVSPPLTTIDQQLRVGASIMTDLLIARIAGMTPGSARIEPRLIRRQSS
jgi:DNA-binding LacI/PurR family transcriptional regulator